LNRKFAGNSRQRRIMFKKIIESRQIIKNILAKRAYFLIFLFSSVLIFSIFYILTLATTTDHSLSIFIMMNGFWFMVSTFFLLGIAALLFGIYVSLFSYDISERCKGGKIGGFFGAIGLIAGLFGAGCPMCGGALFALIGMPLALFFLPFKGLELRLGAIVLLALAVYFLSRSMIKCKIKRE
jgi:hypothetical protein